MFYDFLSPFVTIIYDSWKVLKTASSVHKELMYYVSLCWLANPGASISRGPEIKVTYESVLQMGGKWLYRCCFVEWCFRYTFNTTQHCYVVLIKFFLHTLLASMWCIHTVVLISYLPDPSALAGYDTRSIFKRSLTGLNSEISFS